MGNNLIHNYLNNMNNTQPIPSAKSERSYFGVPTVTSTIEAFDQESDKLIKPLDGKGHLVNGDLVHMPKEFVRDTVYTTKALADGVRGKANDHQLGKMNDLGLKLSGIAIAAYLMTKKSTPKTKAMEFVGFGAFLASMALWPKIALEIPARIVHGFNFRKQYIDEQGRKKYVSQDPNYIPFDLYKGDKKSENLDVIGDRLGIKKDIPNRHEAVKDQMRKISVQNNTMWMLTAGIATPLMTALACNQAEPFIGKWAEKYSNKKVNAQIDKIDDYLNGIMDNQDKTNYETKVLNIKPEQGKAPQLSEVEKLLNGMSGRVIKTEDIANLSDKLAAGHDAEMMDAARADIENLIGGNKYIANSKTADRLADSIHSAISAKDVELAGKITPDKIREAASQGIVRGAVRDLLTSVGVDVIDPSGEFKEVSTNFKCTDVKDLDFFKVTEETKNMSPVDRLTHNIKSIVMKVNNSNPSEDFVSGMSKLEQGNRGLKSAIDAKLEAGARAIAESFYSGELAIGEGRESYVRQSVQQLFKANSKRGPKTDKILGSISDILTADSNQHRGFYITDSVADTIKKADAQMRRYGAVDRVLAEAAHFKVEKASETIVANNWAEVSETLVKELGYTEKEIKLAAKDKDYSNKLFAEKLEKICSDEKSYNDFIKNLSEKMVKLDEKLDAPNANSSGRMMNKIESGIVSNCTQTGEALRDLGFSSMNEKMLSHYNGSVEMNTGSIMSSKILRLHSRVNGVHNTYMRLLQTAEFFHRVKGFETAIIRSTDKPVSELANAFGMAEDEVMRNQIIKKGKEVLLDAHTESFYGKLGSTNNANFFETFMWSVFKPNKGDAWDANWNKSTGDTIVELNKVKSAPESTVAPRRVFEEAERVPVGQKLKEYMNLMYNSFGSIERKVVGNRETVKCGGVSESQARACERFDLLGKTPNDFIHDTLKQKFNSNKWMKTFAPILAVTFGVTLLSQFFFGKKDPDIKA